MVFSSHVTLGKYSLTIELYWAKQTVCKSEFGKRIRTQRFVLTFFSLPGPQRLRLLALAAGLAKLPFESAVWFQ